MTGSQDFGADPRNANALVYVNGRLVPRADAVVSVFDAGFALGDGIWEGIRFHRGCPLFLAAHLDRLRRGAAAIALDIGRSAGELEAAVLETARANGMTHGAHLRLMITRGEKATINQDPRNALGRATLVITAEFKTPSETLTKRGLALKTSSIRCPPASVFDMRINSHSRLPLILALQEVIEAGADEALMLDTEGFVSSCNATNFFWVKSGTVFTSDGQSCFQGITRGQVMSLCAEAGIPVRCGRFPPEEARAADEAFVTGTFGGVTPVREIDGHAMPATPGALTRRITALYNALKDREARLAA